MSKDNARYELTLTLTASVRLPGATGGRTRAVTVRGDYVDPGASVAAELGRRAERGALELARSVERDVEDALDPPPAEVELEGDWADCPDFAVIRRTILDLARTARRLGPEERGKLRGVRYPALYAALPGVDPRRVSKVANYLINTTHPERPPELGRAGDEFWYVDPARDRRGDGRRWVVALDCAADGLGEVDSGIPVEPPETVSLRIVFAGSSALVSGGYGEPLARFRERALSELGAADPYSVDSHEVRDASGRVLDQRATPRSLPLASGDVLYVSPAAGAGGSLA